MKNYAVVLASGTGSRTGLSIPKQFFKIKEKTVLEYSVDAFENNLLTDGIVVVSNPDYIDLTYKTLKGYKKIINIVKGGTTRQISASIGISALDAGDNDNVLIHDAVRPFISQDIINNCISALNTYKAVNVAIKTADTIIEIDENNFIKNVPERSKLMRCQTPQAFKYSIIKKAHELAKKDCYFSASDDCGLILKYSLANIYVVSGSENNIKITYLSDLNFAENYISYNNV